MSQRINRRLALALPAALASSLWAGRARATPGVDEPPLPQPPRPMQWPPLHEHTLANGLTVVVAPRPGLPLVSLTLAVRAGPEADPADRPGVADMLATLWPKGASRDGKPVGASEIARQAEALGSPLVTKSSWGASTLAMTVTTARAEPALALLADVLRAPSLRASELERARTQALDGLRVSLSSPGEVSQWALRRSFWGDTPHGRVAPPAAVQRLALRDLRAHQTTWVRPDQIALVLAGDITPEAGQALAQRLLGDWPTPSNAAASPAWSAPRPMARGLVLIDLPGAGQSSVAVAAPFVAQGAADWRIGLVANAVLGGGYSARLNQVVRIQRGLSYGANSVAEAFAGGGMVAAQCQTHHPNAGEVLTLLQREITRLADTPPSAAELAARQASLVGSLARQMETTAGLSAMLVRQWAAGRPLTDLSQHVPQILAVTAGQVQAFARQHWQAGALRSVVVGDLGAAGAALGGIPDALRLHMAEVDLEQPGLRKPG